MMTAIVVAALLSAGTDGGTSSEMFNAQKGDLIKEATKKVEEKKLPAFSVAVKAGAEGLAETFTKKLGVKTTVKSILVSESDDKSPDMAVVTFTNAKETFGLVFLGVDGELKVLPRDFKEL